MSHVRMTFLDGRVALEAPVGALAALAGAILLGLGLVLLSVTLGRIDLPLAEALAVLVGRAPEDAALIAGELRLPRALTAALAGGLLALSGGLLQGATRNPLADPALVGVSQGAGLAVVALTVLAPGIAGSWQMAAAFAGGIGAVTVTLSLSGAGASMRFLLIGIGITAFLGAATGTLLAYGGISEAHGALAWYAGSVRSTGWAEVRLMAWASVAACTLALLAARPLATLRLGDDLSGTLGHPPTRTRTGITVLAALSAAASVAVAGPIAFVGLLAPHAAARLARSGPGLHLALSWAVGACLLMAADLAGRTAFAEVQIPAGLVTALLGAPGFALLLCRRSKGPVP